MDGLTYRCRKAPFFILVSPDAAQLFMPSCKKQFYASSKKQTAFHLSFIAVHECSG
jgi:hypothetical protein